MVKSSFKLPAGVSYLYGAMYRVRLAMIQVADAGFDPASKQFEFRNPRWHTLNGKPQGCGLSPEKMQELRESIRDLGLNHPLRCRWYPFQNDRSASPVSVQLVDGERRFRSMCWLVKENQPCYDAATGDMVEAKKLYEYVDCMVTEMDDDTALSYALEGNDKSEDIGTGATIAMVQYLRHCGKTDPEIIAITRKSPDWLCKTEKLLGLDPDILLALKNDQINRKVAQRLGQIEDVKERRQRLQLALDANTEKIADLKAAIAEADAETEMTKAELVVAEEMGLQTSEIASRLDKAKKKSKRIRARSEAPRTSIASNKDLERGGAKVERQPVTDAKRRKFLYEPICDILKAKGLDAEGNPLHEDLDTFLDCARSIKTDLEFLEGGFPGEAEAAAMDLLKQHMKRRAKTPIK